VWRKGHLPQRLKPAIEWRDPAGLPDRRAELSREMLLRQACGDQLSQRLPILLPVLPRCDSELALWHEGLRTELGKHPDCPKYGCVPTMISSLLYVWFDRFRSSLA
jgi:hypothetical protein